jgi:hypothetical protein
MKSKSVRRELLEESIELIDGDKNRSYGAPGGDFATTAEFWQTYLNRTIAKRGNLVIEKHDVAVMMNLLKISRIAWMPDRRDSWADVGGYTGCGWECVGEENAEHG